MKDYDVLNELVPKTQELHRAIFDKGYEQGQKDILEQLSVTPKEKIGHCKDCKWWKDSDGVYRRGIGAKSRCPINCKVVYEGNGYCFVYEPQESENDNGD